MADYSDNHDEIAEDHPHSNGGIPENSNTTVDMPDDGNEAVETTAEPFTSPLPSSPVGSSNERAAHKPVHDNSATPIGPTKRKGSLNIKTNSKERKTLVKFKEPLLCRSDRIKTASRVKKVGVFLIKNRLIRKRTNKTFQGHPNYKNKIPWLPRMRKPPVLCISEVRTRSFKL